MLILSRYTMKEILSHLAGVLVLVVAIFLVRRLASFLGDAAEGALPVGVIFQLLTFRTIMALPSLLPVGLYIAVLLALGRLYQDNEVTALAACGVPARRVYTAVIVLSVFAAMAAALLSFLARPWAAARFHTVRDQAAGSAGMGQIRPGRFYEMKGGVEEVVFAERRSTSDPRFMENVFVQQRDADGISVLFAARAMEIVDEQHGYRFLRLFDGYRYDLGADGSRYDVTQYEELVIRTPIEVGMPERPQDRIQSAWALAQSSDLDDVAELQWRIASPVSAFLLALLAIALSRINPGQGRYVKLLIATLLYFGYSQLLGTTKRWVANGTWPPLPGTWVVHGFCLLTALALFAAYGLGDLRARRWTAAARLHPRAPEFDP